MISHVSIQPMLSFLLPCYNVGSWVEATLDSIVSQFSNSAQFEICCYDDASTDETFQLLNRYKERHPSIPFFVKGANVNKGVSYSRNQLIDMAHGDFVWFVDPDDLLVNGVAKQLLNQAIREGADAVLGNYQRVSEGYNADRPFEICSLADTFHTVDGGIELPLDSDGTAMCAVWCGLFRRTFLLETKLRFKVGIIAQEDTLFYFELEQLQPQIIKTNAVIYLYRQRSSSIMHLKSPEKNFAYYRSMVIMLSTYKQYRDSGRYVDAASLIAKIHHSRENIAYCLAKVTDSTLVGHELNHLKDSGDYPYHLRWDFMRRPENKLKLLAMLLLPCEPIFWTIHFVLKFVQVKLRGIS